MNPILILHVWLTGLLSLGIVGAGAWFGHEWYQRSWGWDPITQQSVFAPDFGSNTPTMLLLAALALLLLMLAGSALVRLVLKSKRKTKDAADQPDENRSAAASRQKLERPDGSKIEVEFYGPEDAQPIVLTHGWGLDSNEWTYLKRELPGRFRLIVWDEPGLGLSKAPDNRDFSVEKFARDLEAVLSLAGSKPAFLLGHSIGGMIILTFCRLFPEALGSRVNGLVLTHTTYTNPVRTVKGAGFYSAIEKPVLVPLMYLTIALAPLVRLMTWLSYYNGLLHLSSKRSSFAGTETWEQLDFSVRFQLRASPSVLARGMLGMMKYDATHVLPQIHVPVCVVAGDKDGTCKPEASERISRDIPNARLATLSPAKHLGLIEHHRKYAELVHEFSSLTKHAETGAGAGGDSPGSASPIETGHDTTNRE